jgi:hypothetical protein
MAGGGILIILTVIIGRWLDARSWLRSLSAIHPTEVAPVSAPTRSITENPTTV